MNNRVGQVLAVDPGDERSAYVLYEVATGLPKAWAIVTNHDLLRGLGGINADLLAIEMISYYGEKFEAGRHIFATCVWIGRFYERWGMKGLEDLGFDEAMLVERRAVLSHLCRPPKSTGDSAVMRALIDRYGPTRERAVGTKKAPGPLHASRNTTGANMSSHCWQALGLAVTVADTLIERERVA